MDSTRTSLNSVETVGRPVTSPQLLLAHITRYNRAPGDRLSTDSVTEPAYGGEGTPFKPEDVRWADMLSRASTMPGLDLHDTLYVSIHTWKITNLLRIRQHSMAEM